MKEYPKIPSPFIRFVEGENKGKFIRDAWAKPEFYYLRKVDWSWSEKIDGTNIRIGWDGHKVSINGRTDNAQLHMDLVKWIEDNITEEMFEQTFGEQSVTLYGEGFGAGIQKMGVNYSDTKQFILFDVLINDLWLLPDDVDKVGADMGIKVVERWDETDVLTAIGDVEAGITSEFGDFLVEGLVGTPGGGLLNRFGGRIQMKLKSSDFRED